MYTQNLCVSIFLIPRFLFAAWKRQLVLHTPYSKRLFSLEPDRQDASDFVLRPLSYPNSVFSLEQDSSSNSSFTLSKWIWWLFHLHFLQSRWCRKATSSLVLPFINIGWILLGNTDWPNYCHIFTCRHPIFNHQACSIFSKKLYVNKNKTDIEINHSRKRLINKWSVINRA